MKSANLLVGLVLSAGALVAGDFTEKVTWETLPSFCEANVLEVKKPVRGIMVFHHGLGHVAFRGDFQPGFYKEHSEKGIVVIHPLCSPWGWGNDASVKLADRLVDCVVEHFGLPKDVPVCSTGGSMGGLAALVYARYSRKNVVAAVANCPVCDLPYHYVERRDLPRTLASAYADAPDFDAALKAHSPLHLAAEMPDIDYFVAHSTADKSVNKERHSDRFVAEMRRVGRRITYVASEGTGHCKLLPPVKLQFDAAIMAAFFQDK